MIKSVLTAMLFIASNLAIAQHSAGNPSITYKNNVFYNVFCGAGNKLIIFLHGGVSNPYFKQPAEKIELNYIVEHNNTFMEQATERKIDLVIPVANDQFDWLSRPEASFRILEDYISSLPGKYNEIYIAGFSDGGTGSYKIFYTHPSFFSGLIVFNGYPQHSNFYKHVNYSAVTGKKIMFFGIYDDDVIPYEFLLTEYCKQKALNANTYFYLAKGAHSFKNYKEPDIHELFAIIENEVGNSKTEPIHGYIKNDVLVELYPFRKKILRRYNYGSEVYEENLLQFKKYRK